VDLFVASVLELGFFAADDEVVFRELLASFVGLLAELE